jgi:hypothetical protein
MCDGTFEWSTKVNWLVFKNTGAGFDKFVPKIRRRPDEQLRNVVEEDMRRKGWGFSGESDTGLNTNTGFLQAQLTISKVDLVRNRQIKGASS